MAQNKNNILPHDRGSAQRMQLAAQIRVKHAIFHIRNSVLLIFFSAIVLTARR